MARPAHDLLRRLALGAALAGVLLGASAQEPAPPPATLPAPLPTQEAQGWLSRISAAANERSYRGTMVFSAEGVVSSSRVAHYCDGKQFLERVEALDGRQQRVYRHNHQVHTVWPQERVVVVERRDAPVGLVSIRRAVEPVALRSYTLHAQDRQRVAGRMAQVLVLRPVDEWRFAQRLWADVETGLLLRSDVLDPQSRVLESSSFSEIEVGASVVTPAALLDGMKPEGYKEMSSPNRVVDLGSEGWSVRQPVPGFELMGCLKRPRHGTDRGHVLQAVFSDGLSFVSVFIEPFDAGRHTQALAAGLGATGTLMRREGPHWLTVMGDVPRHTLERFLRAIEPAR